MRRVAIFTKEKAIDVVYSTAKEKVFKYAFSLETQ